DPPSERARNPLGSSALAASHVVIVTKKRASVAVPSRFPNRMWPPAGAHRDLAATCPPAGRSEGSAARRPKEDRPPDHRRRTSIRPIVAQVAANPLQHPLPARPARDRRRVARLPYPRDSLVARCVTSPLSEPTLLNY